MQILVPLSSLSSLALSSLQGALVQQPLVLKEFSQVSDTLADGLMGEVAEAEPKVVIGVLAR